MNHDPRLSNLSDEELISAVRISDDPAVCELVDRLIENIDDPREENAELEALVDELTNTPCSECEHHETESKRVRDKHEKLVAHLDEQIKRLQARDSETSPQHPQIEKDETMLEQQIEALTTRVAAVESEQGKTNELLAEILTAIRDGSSTPSAPTKTAKAEKPVKGAAKVKAVADNDDADKTVTKDDVIEALLSFKQEDGTNPVGKQIVADFSEGDQAHLKNVPESKYPEVLAACEAVRLKEAA